MTRPSEVEEMDLYEARDRLEDFCDDIGGVLRKGSFNTDEKFVCDFDSGKISITSPEGVDVEEMTGRMQIPDNWDLNITIETDDVEIRDATVPADSLARDTMYTPTLTSLNNGVDTGHFKRP